MTRDVPLSFFGMDPRSTVLMREGRIVRTGVDMDLSRVLLASEAVCRLIADGSLVDTEVLSGSSGDCVLQHHRIDPFLYPGEWSFSMFRDAGLQTLHVQSRLHEAGFQLKDAHSYNVTFEGVRPVFIDFASMERADSRYTFWRAGAEYIDAFVRILRIWSRTNLTCALAYVNAVWARREDEILVRNGRRLLTARLRLGRAYDKALVATAMTYQARASAFEKVGLTGWKRAVAQPALGALSLVQKAIGHPFELDDMRRLTESIAPPIGATMWANYQQNLGLHDAPTLRFQRIMEIVAGLSVADAFELGCNQGALAEELIKRKIVKSVICADYDEHAVDALYRRVKDKRVSGITPLVRNIMLPDPIRCDSIRALSGDVVIALALTHHLLLSQNYRLDAVLDRIASYGRRYMIVEFMPKGLWYQGSGMPIPSWYTQSWFAEGLQRFGNVLLAEKLEENRVVFLVQLSRQ